MKLFTATSFIWCIGLCILAPTIAGADAVHIEEYKPSATFQRLQVLEGTWEGTHSMGPNEKVTVEYQLTSGGSALLERIFSGTPNEMVSVYTENNGNVEMTHYCMLGNAPRMGLQSASKNTFRFNFIGGTNMRSEHDPHMHQLTMVFKNDDTIVQDWVMFKDGKAEHKNTVTLRRVS